MTIPEVGQTVTVWWSAARSFSPITVDVVGKSGEIRVRLPNGGQVWIVPEQLRKMAPKR